MILRGRIALHVSRLWVRRTIQQKKKSDAAPYLSLDDGGSAMLPEWPTPKQQNQLATTTQKPRFGIPAAKARGRKTIFGTAGYRVRHRAILFCIRHSHLWRPKRKLSQIYATGFARDHCHCICIVRFDFLSCNIGDALAVDRDGSTS